MESVRFAVLGGGNIGLTHMRTLASDAVPDARLTAAIVRNPESLAAADLPDGVELFADLDTFFAADVADAVVVATPTNSHLALGKAVLEGGCHLVMEKPVGMSAHEIKALVDAVPEGRIAAAMLNQRYHPVYQEMRRIVSNGTLGGLVRFNWIMTSWYRPDVYFQVSPWRGTWPGEGGGALVNQCIHNLDVLQWLVGLPDAVMADVRYGKFHDIDVEDEVSALLTYENGLSGTLIASTGEAPGINRFDLVGDLGSLSYDGETLTLSRAHGSVAEHCATTREMFSVPKFETQIVDVQEDGVNQHAQVFNDVVAAINGSGTLATPLSEGLASVTLANALHLSDWEDRKISLPMDASDFPAKLQARIAGSDLRQPQDIEVHIDMDASYR